MIKHFLIKRYELFYSAFLYDITDTVTMALLQLVFWVCLSIGTLRSETLTFLVIVCAALFSPQDQIVHLEFCDFTPKKLKIKRLNKNVSYTNDVLYIKTLKSNAFQQIMLMWKLSAQKVSQISY